VHGNAYSVSVGVCTDNAPIVPLGGVNATVAVYRPIGVITDGLSLRNGYGVPHQQAIGLTAARSTMQQALLQTVYRCGMGTAFPINRLSD